MKVVAIVQARTGSIRFPGKILAPIRGIPMIEFLLRRLATSKALDEVLVATSDNPVDDELTALVQGLHLRVVRGSERDVLDRYCLAAESAQADVVVRLTGDCPLVDPALVDQMVAMFLEMKIDYLSNTIDPTFPDGLDVEVFSRTALEKSRSFVTTDHEVEHVTPLMKHSSMFRRHSYTGSRDYSAIRWTVDEEDDLLVVSQIVEEFWPHIDFSWTDAIELYDQDPSKYSNNSHLLRGAGSEMSNGQKLWRRAQRRIPGGTMLLSKRPEMYLPGKWPTYFSRTSGCRIWDLDGQEYLDMAAMGFGTNVLGYSRPEVDDAVREVVNNGNLSTLICPEEVYLAETLIDLHPWATMARFARTGGEACAIAVRIGRAASRRTNVAVCGYHGWHDWYLASNLQGNDQLDGHLLPGLDPVGVPSELAGTVHTFEYNDIETLALLVAKHNIGTIIMEVQRDVTPNTDFIKSVRSLATDNHIVLIFDESTSGLRQTLGGIHLEYQVDPDIAVFAKALGNGYAIAAVIGTEEIMALAEESFISSTFWTDRLGSAAALATLEVMGREQTWKSIVATGLTITHAWQRIAGEFGLKLRTNGLTSIPQFRIDSPRERLYKTYISQEMLRVGILASNRIYICTEHTPAIVDQYLGELAPIFGRIAEMEDGRSIENVIEGELCQTGFKRLN